MASLAVVPNEQQPFLIAFDESLRKLNDINAAISKNTENKKKFTGDVLDKLQELHEKVKRIVIRITEIKQKIVALQGQINQNNSGVQAKESEIVNLKQQLDQLTTEKNTLTTQLSDANANITRFQQQIDKNEADLRDLTAKNAELETSRSELDAQLNALRADVQSKGDSQTQAHADQLKQLTEQHGAEIQRLNDQIAENQKQIAANEQKIQELSQQHGSKETQMQDLVNRNTELENTNKDLEGKLNVAVTDYNNLQSKLQQLEADLQDRTLEGREFLDRCEKEKAVIEKQIEENNRKIGDLESVIKERDNQIASLQQNTSDISNSQQAKDAEIANLNNTIVQITNIKNDLEKERDNLRAKIEAATVVITNIVSNLAELTNQKFYDDSMGAVTNKITEIERELENITIEIQDGNQSNAPQQINRTITYQRQKIAINDLLRGLKTKGDQVTKNTGNSSNKYSKAYEMINSNLASNPNISDDQLNSLVGSALNSIDIEADAFGISVKGGYKFNSKKTKKHNKKQPRYTRKQKGGFVWGKQKTSSIKKTKTTTPLTNSSSKKNIKLRKDQTKHRRI